ncbi:alcohol dehydrogenase catalytic domain-containing protein [Streptomyces sp. NPDC001985]|uniref:alcohol dehydrogenase catalytic domain-containing protein n=1 Tax=Streptomyces sp. NPDC001985 TaxID=3154406 RepID=UPI00331CA5B4
MRATYLHGAGDIRVEKTARPRIEEPTDAVVRVTLACVCGSDLHPYRASPDGPEPTPMGHEFLGVVEETGAEVTGLAEGDFVVSPFAFADNTCAICREGFQTACPRGGWYGAGGVGGAQAEAVRVPQAAGTLVKIPGDADAALLPSLLALSDVYLTGYHAAHMGRVSAGKTVTVIGDGAVGLSAVLAAARMGADRIILMGRHEDRTGLGREWGADDVVAERGDEGVARVRELTGGEGSHVVLEAVGLLPAYEQAYGIVRAGGVVSRVGVPQYEEAPVGFGSLFGKNATLTGGPAPVRAYLDEALRDVLDGRIEPGRVFDAEVPLDRVADAYRAMDTRARLKVMVRP